MRRFFCVAMVTMLLLVAQTSWGCVGRTLHIGITDNSLERILGEVISLLITERTGTTVKVQVYRDTKELYAAVRKGDVNLLVETPDRAMEILGKPVGGDGPGSREAIRSLYRSTFNLAWLEPFGGTPPYAPVLTVETLGNYPALPKLLAKLAGTFNNDAYARLSKSAGTPDKARNGAREFLKSKKLI